MPLQPKITCAKYSIRQYADKKDKADFACRET